MQKPDESLDIDKPPGEESQDITGDAEVLKPVADGEVSTPSANPFLSWLRGSLAVGTVLAMIILVFLSVLSGVFIALDKSPAPRPEVATNARPAEELAEAETEEPLSFDSFAESNFEPAPPVRTHAARRRRSRSPRIHVKGYRTRRLRRIRRPLVPLFMPTTLVIYVENGVIKTRIEPWLQTPR